MLRVSAGEAGVVPLACAAQPHCVLSAAETFQLGLPLAMPGQVVDLATLPACICGESCGSLVGGRGNGLALVLERRDAWLWALAIAFPAGLRPRYERGIAALLRRIAPDLGCAFRIAHGIGTREQPDRATIEEQWDAIDTGVALLSSDLKPLACNQAAEEEFSVRRYFAPPGKGGRLRAAKRSDHAALAASAARVGYGESHEEMVTIAGLGRARPLSITLRAVRRWDGLGPYHARSDGPGVLVALVGDRRVIEPEAALPATASGQ